MLCLFLLGSTRFQSNIEEQNQLCDLNSVRNIEWLVRSRHSVNARSFIQVLDTNFLIVSSPTHPAAQVLLAPMCNFVILWCITLSLVLATRQMSIKVSYSVQKSSFCKLQ